MSQRKSQQNQPKTYTLTFTAVLALPFRLCNPPPAVGKVRSCGVTPIYDVKLEDVLDRKHLPPLGLKDLEEWLLYVELCPENLYFLLWLKEYKKKYARWLAQSRTRPIPIPSSDLAWFYARCKQTFLTPNSSYELIVPSHLLAPFHVPRGIGSPHPDPAVFDAVAIEVQNRLKDSLQRFVTAQFSNVGNNRVLCGLVAGSFAFLVGGLLPLVYNIICSHSRWMRLTALPGLWLGAWLIFTSLQGICLGVYVFGDLRQLRKFELVRPPISKPQPLDQPLSPPPQMPPPVYSPRQAVSASSLYSHQSTSSSGSESLIHISPAYYDADPIEGPAVSSRPPVVNFTSKSEFDDDEDDDGVFVPTAAFIKAYEHSSEDEAVYERKHVYQQNFSISTFDFDALPKKPVRVLGAVRPSPNPHMFVIEPEEQEAQDKGSFLLGFLRRVQARCIGRGNRWMVFTSNGDSGSNHTSLRETLIRKQFKMVKAVPAFGSPLTRVLSPVVVRGQWEIVVRSLVCACVFCWVVLAALLAVPVRG